jgi:hypothetical protein
MSLMSELLAAANSDLLAAALRYRFVGIAKNCELKVNY